MSADLEQNPSQRYQVAAGALLSLKPNVQNFSAKFNRTLGALQGYSNDFEAISKCTNLKVEMQIFEQHLCFEFGRTIYILLVLSTVSTVVLFVIMWCLCLAVRAFSDQHKSVSLVSRISLTGLRNRELIPRV